MSGNGERSEKLSSAEVGGLLQPHKWLEFSWKLSGSHLDKLLEKTDSVFLENPSYSPW